MKRRMTFPGNSLLTATGAALSGSAVVLHVLGFMLEFGFNCAQLLRSNLRSQHLWKFVVCVIASSTEQLVNVDRELLFFHRAGSGSWFSRVLGATDIFLLGVDTSVMQFLDKEQPGSLAPCPTERGLGGLSSCLCWLRTWNRGLRNLSKPKSNSST